MISYFNRQFYVVNGITPAEIVCYIAYFKSPFTKTTFLNTIKNTQDNDTYKSVFIDYVLNKPIDNIHTNIYKKFKEFNYVFELSKDFKGMTFKNKLLRAFLINENICYLIAYIGGRSLTYQICKYDRNLNVNERYQFVNDIIIKSDGIYKRNMNNPKSKGEKIEGIQGYYYFS